jgi:hypothetical protein
VRTQAIIGTVVSTVVLLACCCNVLAIPSIVTSAMAISRADRDLASARTLMRWTWWLLGAAVVISIAGSVLWAIFSNTVDNIPSGTT